MKLLHSYHMMEENMAGMVTSMGMGGVLMGYMNMFAGMSGSGLYMGMMMTSYGGYSWMEEMSMESTYNGDHNKKVMEGMSMGWKLWMMSEVLMFGSMFMSYYYMTFEGNMNTGSKEPGLGMMMAEYWSMPSWNTVLLTMLGMSMMGWEKNMGANKSSSSMSDYMWTVVMMWMFMMSQYYEFYNGWMTMGDGGYGSMYYGMIGLHGMHCVLGEGMMMYTGMSLMKYEYDEENNNNVWACGMNIHFLMGAWMMMFLLMYM